MRSNKWLTADSGYKSCFLSYRALSLYTIIEFILTIILFTKEIGVFWVDTYSYIAAADRVMQGSIDIFRTPVYPLIIGVLRSIFGAGWSTALAIIQFILFCLSAYYLYKLAIEYIKKNRIVFWIIAFYLLYPGIQNFCQFMLTEVFAISFTIFLTYSLLQILKKTGTIRSCIWPCVWLFLLIFLRPVFIFMIPILLLFYIVMLIGRKINTTQAILAFAAIAIVCGTVFAYKSAINRKYGISSISSVTSINNYFTIRYAGIIEPKLTTDTILRQELIKTLPNKGVNNTDTINKEIKQIMSTVSTLNLEAYENAAIKTHKTEICKGIIYRWAEIVRGHEAVNSSMWYPTYTIQKTFMPGMAFYFLFLIVITCITLVNWKMQKLFPYQSAFLITVCFGLFFTSVIGAQAEYSRLTMPTLPLFLLLFGKFCALFRRDNSTQLG